MYQLLLSILQDYDNSAFEVVKMSVLMDRDSNLQNYENAESKHAPAFQKILHENMLNTMVV